jgi:hypothetical protein
VELLEGFMLVCDELRGYLQEYHRVGKHVGRHQVLPALGVQGNFEPKVIRCVENGMSDFTVGQDEVPQALVLEDNATLVEDCLYTHEGVYVLVGEEFPQGSLERDKALKILIVV